MKELPEWKRSYGAAGTQRERQEKLQEASRQRQDNAETSKGYPDLSTLRLSDQEVHKMFDEALEKRLHKQDSVSILVLAKDVLKNLETEISSTTTKSPALILSDKTDLRAKRRIFFGILVS